ncbi:YggT family protein [Pseudohaliea sp.]|jgi:YggT family protein|uniref:YggT family protein n=1 Tax=Pseudohaliea sp. TaxID=2740289 RepID=UPI0032EF9F6D
MSAMNEIFAYLVQTALSLYLLVMLLRFLFHFARADFYNPISQFVVRATNPLVRPTRRLFPAFGRFDSASLVLAVVLQALGIVTLLLLHGAGLVGPTLIVAWSVIGVLGLLVNIYFFALLAMIIISWVAPTSRHPALLLLWQITEPVMAPVRRILPPMGGLDFSPILVFILINVLQIALRHMAAGVGLHPALVMGV